MIYWVATGLVSVMMVYSAIAYFVAPNLAGAFSPTGLRGYFKLGLGAGMLLGVGLLWWPVPAWLKKWTYVLFVILFIPAFMSHLLPGSPVIIGLIPVALLLFHWVSYCSYRFLHYQPVPPATGPKTLPAGF